jgi:transposase
MRAAEQSRDDVAEARADWRDEQSKLKVERLVFVDETWASTNMAPRYGRGPKGKRVEGSALHGHWLTTTFVAALRHDRIDAPCVPPHASRLAWGPRAFDGPINGDCFRAWTEQSLAPTLQPGDIVILDNLSSHKVASVRAAIEARGAQLVYLPPYSPDLNPIEQLFAKLKHFLRKARARTVDTWHDAIGKLLDLFSSNECRNDIRNAGYGSI